MTHVYVLQKSSGSAQHHWDGSHDEGEKGDELQDWRWVTPSTQLQPRARATATVSPLAPLLSSLYSRQVHSTGRRQRSS